MSTNIVETIRTRLDSMGMSQAQFAKQVSATPSQMSIFLKGNGSLSTKCLNNSLDLVGIDLSLYSNRNNLAKRVASFLISKNVSSIENWTKNDLAIFTQQKEISLLFDVQSEEEYIELEQSGIIDIESTFPYFKAMVTYFMSLDGIKPTASRAKQALEKLMKEPTHNKENQSKKMDNLATAGVAIGTIAAAAALFPSLGVASISKQVGAFSLFLKNQTASLFAKGVNLTK